MKGTKIGNRLFLSIISMFIIFVLTFVVYQQRREKRFKVEILNTKLQDYNLRMMEVIDEAGAHDEKILERYFQKRHLPNQRVTIVDFQGNVTYDSHRKDYDSLPSHANRQEIIDALRYGSGYSISRQSSTMKQDYFYSATEFKEDGLVVRSGLPYDSELVKSLRADSHYLWFALAIFLFLTVILYRFVRRLGNNVWKLRLFAERADNNESLETEELAQFTDDELGDIAERIVTLYKQLIRTKEEQTVLKRQLTQNIAHELKTPVASIQGYLETIHDNPDIDAETKKTFIERSYAQTKRLTALLQDISTLNRMDDAPQVKTFENIDIRTIIDNVVKETALERNKREMTMRCEVPDTMPAKGNASLVYSIFRNLTDNAIAYAGVGKTITLTAEKEGDRWHFLFQDNGVGVAAEHLPRIFERFYRVDKGRSRKMGGTGLGLAIVKNAVMLHEGTISVCNVETGGLRFDFTLPA